MAARPEFAGDTCVVRSCDISVELSRQGEIMGIAFGESTKLTQQLVGHTQLEGWRTQGQVDRKALDNGGIEFTKRLQDFMPYRVAASQHRRCILVERFTPSEDSVRWEIEVHTEERDAWSTAVLTHLVWPDAGSAKFWTTWDDSRYYGPFLDKDTVDKTWSDPLAPIPFKALCLDYGGHYWLGGGFCIPIATVIKESEDVGLSLVLSPEDILLDLKLVTDERGSIVFSRINHRIVEGKPLRFAMDIVAHEGDWRSGLSWMVDRYPAFFNPPNPDAHEIAGCGAYSLYTGDFDAIIDMRLEHSTGGYSLYEGRFDSDKYRKMSFRVNWQSSFEFPYMGMYLPPVEDKEEWINFRNIRTSFWKVNDYCQRMRALGFYVLSYFNVAEFGTQIQFPPRGTKPMAEADLWRDANDFLYSKLADAMLLGTDGRPIWTWDNAIGMDFGEPVYQEFLLEQARRHLDKVPASSGICIDRLDWLAIYNQRRDDGVSWINDKPAHSLLMSWKDIMGKLGPMMHGAGKVIYINPHFRRLEVMREVDGVFDEFTYVGFNINACGFLGLRKPVLGWTSTADDLKPDPDAFFQRYLHMGIYPMAPFPGNDHSIQPDDWADRFYLDYGPLLDAIRGKKWVLLPHAIEVVDQLAKANLFEVSDGFVMPVTFGGKASSVGLTIRILPGISADPREVAWEVIHPGREIWSTIKAIAVEQRFRLEVPLHRGCAVVRVRPHSGDDGSRSIPTVGQLG